ncbi:type II toxin-antitoxin system RelE/ParE family toxin [Algibacter sp. 2305UL17-15]|uniref:type II toxin-antitoxin system RelE/ParE family toxin n=1 Tax=Algibacter sp. 2305UL17-15 TaxID=3231268 RepID=UPI00345933BC
MAYIIKFEALTLIEFNKVIKHYEDVSIDLADRFHHEFWNKIDGIKDNPLHYQIRYKNIRIAHLKVFPYGIHFIIEGKIIHVFNILHHKQYYK